MSSVRQWSMGRLFVIFVCGLVGVGCGQELVSVGVVEPLLHELHWVVFVACCGVVLLVLGWGLLLWLLVLVLHRVPSRSRVMWLLLGAVGVVLLCAVCAGFASWLLSGSGLVSYGVVKRVMWVCTAVVAVVVKACVVAVVVAWLAGSEVSWKTRWLWYVLLVVGVVVASIAGVSVLVPRVVADIGLHVVDVALLIGVVLVTRVKVREQ